MYQDISILSRYERSFQLLAIRSERNIQTTKLPQTSQLVAKSEINITQLNQTHKFSENIERVTTKQRYYYNKNTKSEEKLPELHQDVLCSRIRFNAKTRRGKIRNGGNKPMVETFTFVYMHRFQANYALNQEIKIEKQEAISLDLDIQIYKRNEK